MVLSPLRTYSLSRKLERGLRSRTTALRAGARHSTRNETKRNTLLGGGSGFFEPLSIEFNSAESGEPSDPTKREENRHYYYEKKTGVRTMSLRRPRVLILGTGWAGNKVARKLDKTKFDVRSVL